MKHFIPVNEPLINGNERQYLTKCIETGWISSEGPFVKEFEDKMAALVGRKYGVAVCNGTAALEVAVAALELEPGDEVIMPTFTIISCAVALVRRGCIPVLVDCDPFTWNMNVSQVKKRITPKTKAILAVHTYGLPVEMNPIIELAENYDLKIIEDAAEMHGQTYNGNYCGSFGHISTFSFYSNKHITTGEGGMVITDDEKLADRSISLRNLCFQPRQRFVHKELGFNYRMTNLQAALGLAQLERLNEFIEIKRNMGEKYTELLKDLPGLQLPLEKTGYATNIYWVYGIVLKNLLQTNNVKFMASLYKKGIGTRPFFWPMHRQPVFRKMGLFKHEDYPVADNLSRQGFYIPSGLALTETQINSVSNCLREIVMEKIK